MATLGDRVQSVQFKLGNRTDLTQPLTSGTVTGVVQTVALTGAGTGFEVGDIVTLVQAGGSGASIEVLETNDSNGSIVDFAVYTGGSGYSAGSGVTGTGGSGTGLVVTITVASIPGPSRILYWLQNAYINLMYANRFPGTEGTFTFTTVQGQDQYSYPPSCRAIEALTLYRPDGTIITVETKDIKYIRRMNPTNQASPSMWAEYGKFIYFRPVPDANGPYTCVLDMWLNPVIANPIQDTEILLPDDWLEALDYEAAVRGHTDLQEEDKAHAIQSLLYGYVDPQTGKYTPGMIQNLQTRIQASAPFKDWGMQPKGQTIKYTGRR